MLYLGQLNAGVLEKICLSSRDDDIVLIVSYAELKRCLDSSFAELITATAHSAQQANSSFSQWLSIADPQLTDLQLIPQRPNCNHCLSLWQRDGERPGWLQVLESPWKKFSFFRAFEVFGNPIGVWKFWNLMEEGLERSLNFILFLIIVTMMWKLFYTVPKLYNITW